MQLGDSGLAAKGQQNGTIQQQTPGADWAIWAFYSTLAQSLSCMDKSGRVAVSAAMASAKFSTHRTTPGFQQRQ